MCVLRARRDVFHRSIVAALFELECDIDIFVCSKRGLIIGVVGERISETCNWECDQAVSTFADSGKAHGASLDTCTN